MTNIQSWIYTSAAAGTAFIIYMIVFPKFLRTCSTAKAYTRSFILSLLGGLLCPIVVPIAALWYPVDLTLRFVKWLFTNDKGRISGRIR